MSDNDDSKRGDVPCSLSPVGSEQSGVRPVLIIQNDVGNKFSPTVVAAITSQNRTICHIQVSECGLARILLFA